MTDVLIAPLAAVAVTAILCFTLLRAWNGWLDLRRLDLARRDLAVEAGEAEVGRQWEGPVWTSIYVENKDVFGLTVRATITNLMAATSMWDRIVYQGRRTGPVAFIEHRDRLIGPIFSFQVRGKF